GWVSNRLQVRRCSTAPRIVLRDRQVGRRRLIGGVTSAPIRPAKWIGRIWPYLIFAARPQTVASSAQSAPLAFHMV
ncbi:MAG: hypothetical protein AAFW98_05580, partial [Pseudomonadota bacterium]